MSSNLYLNRGQTVRIKTFRDDSDFIELENESTWSMHLIEQKSEFVLQKSTNSGLSIY